MSAALVARGAVFAGAALLLLPALAAAEPSSAPRREVPDDTWYGWQTLSADGASLALVGAGAAVAAADAPGEMIATGVLVGSIGFVLVTPILHASHGRPGTGVASFAMRSGGMFVSMVTGVGVYSGIACNASSTACAGELGSLDEAIVGAGLGLAVGAAASIAIDAAILAREQTPAAPSASARSVRWSPTGGYDPQQQLTTLGVQGVFLKRTRRSLQGSAPGQLRRAARTR